LINLSWTEEQVKEKGEKIAAVVKKILSEQSVNA